MKKRSLIFIIPAVILTGILCFAVINALCIYIPQEKAQQDYRDLKESLRVAANDDGGQGTASSGGTEPHGAATDGTAAHDAGSTAQHAAHSPGKQETVTEYDFARLSRFNPDYVGWLTADDTLIDYPVMKSAEDSPEYYLHRDFYGNDSVAGCLFIGEGCNSDSTSFVIYGHNMNNDSMFGALDAYYDYTYAEQHRDIRFYVNNEERIYRVFAAFQTKIYDDRDNVFKYYEAVGDLDQETYEQTVAHVRALSEPKLADAPAYPAQLLFLSTCSYHTDDGRFVVAAYRIQ